MFRTKLGFVTALILVFSVTSNSFAMSSLSTVNNAKKVFDLAKVLVINPTLIAELKTGIDGLYNPNTPVFTGLNNKVIENMQDGHWDLQNTIVKPVPINGLVDGGYSITTENAGYKACLASKQQYSNTRLAVRNLLIDGVENGPCKMFSKHKISLVFD